MRKTLKCAAVGWGLLGCAVVAQATTWTLNSAETQGVSYSLTGSPTAQPETWSFQLVATGFNVVSPTTGITGLDALAFGNLHDFVSGTLNGVAAHNGTLGNNGCTGSSKAQFCFGSLNITGLASLHQLTLSFEVTASDGAAFATWTPHLKINWVGSESYGKVSTDMVLTPVPEPASYALMLAGLMVVGVAARRHRRAGGLATPAAT